jgi:hypothetical protein
MYMPNGNAECGEPMCCRNTQGKPKNHDAAAGYWSDYRNCDVPWQTVQNTLQHIKKNHKVRNFVFANLSRPALAHSAAYPTCKGGCILWGKAAKA